MVSQAVATTPPEEKVVHFSLLEGAIQLVTRGTLKNRRTILYLREKSGMLASYLVFRHSFEEEAPGAILEFLTPFTEAPGLFAALLESTPKRTFVLRGFTSWSGASLLEVLLASSEGILPSEKHLEAYQTWRTLVEGTTNPLELYKLLNPQTFHLNLVATLAPGNSPRGLFPGEKVSPERIRRLDALLARGFSPEFLRSLEEGLVSLRNYSTPGRVKVSLFLEEALSLEGVGEYLEALSWELLVTLTEHFERGPGGDYGLKNFDERELAFYLREVIAQQDAPFTVSLLEGGRLAQTLGEALPPELQESALAKELMVRVFSPGALSPLEWKLLQEVPLVLPEASPAGKVALLKLLEEVSCLSLQGGTPGFYTLEVFFRSGAPLGALSEVASAALKVPQEETLTAGEWRAYWGSWEEYQGMPMSWWRPLLKEEEHP